MKNNKICRKSLPPPPHLRVMLLSAATLFTAVLAVTSPAEGDEYVVIVAQPPTAGSNIKFYGINASGQAVGQVTITEGDPAVATLKACVWLPDDAYGLDAGLNILNHSFEDFDRSIAYDINDIGVIVGQMTIDGDSFPFVWDLSWDFDSGAIYDNESPPALLLGVAALDINNDYDPLIVGGAAPMSENPKDVESNGSAFRHNLGTGATTILLPYSSSNQAVAIAISDTPTSSTPLVVGFSGCPVDVPCAIGGCEWPVDGQHWQTSPTGIDLKEIDVCNSDTARTIGYAVNGAGLVVGLGNDPNDTYGANGQSSRVRGLTWPNGPTNAPAALPRFSSTDQNTAVDIRGTASSGPMEIVGKSLALEIGMLWRWNGTSWNNPIDLDDVSCTIGTSRVLRATAINASGWITGYIEGTTGYVLIPEAEYHSEYCVPDIGNSGGPCADGVVDVFDLFVLLANWDTDGTGADFAAPTDKVDVFDLFILLSAWGCGIGGRGEQAVSLPDMVSNAGLVMADWNEYVSVMQTSEDEKEKETYNCWMMRLMSQCTYCPPCGGDNPFEE